ncbi:hypothetical protein ACSXCW_03750 [Clostridium perfringens]|nr:hypothetical protein [Clostridium perfringens]
MSEKEEREGIVIKEYLVTVNKDGTKTKKPLKEITSLPVPTIEETFNEFKKRKSKTTILCMLLYIVIIAIIVYFCLKF